MKYQLKAFDHQEKHLVPGKSQTSREPLTALNKSCLQKNNIIGNHGILRRFDYPVIQAKLKISEPNDIYEKEADRVADVVMRMPPASLENKDGINQRKISSNDSGFLFQKHSDLNEYEINIERKEISNNCTTLLDDQIYLALQFSNTGFPLSESVRSYFEPYFGDLSDVRVHSDSDSAKKSDLINARAFTFGKDIVFSSGEYSPDTKEGKKLLAHELTHFTQQNNNFHNNNTSQQTSTILRSLNTKHETFIGKRLLTHEFAQVIQKGNRSGILSSNEKVDFTGLSCLKKAQNLSELVQLKNGKKENKKGISGEIDKNLAFIFGGVKFIGESLKDMIKKGSLLPSEDNSHICINSDGLLGYDQNYKSPTDPYRWEKIKFIIDSGEKIEINRVKLTTDIIVMSRIMGSLQRKEISLWKINALGLTVPTEAIQRRIYPNETGIMSSIKPDINQIYYSTDLDSPESSSLAHELLGHMWLTIKGVPSVHPKLESDIQRIGTLTEKHKILDPFGKVYTGTVKNFIDLYIGSETFSKTKSPTQFVGKILLDEAILKLKEDFPSKSRGILNGNWEVPKDIDLIWEKISINFELSEKGNTDISKKIEQIIVEWYKSLNINEQYVFYSYIRKVQVDFFRKTRLSSHLLNTIKTPQGMN